MVFTARSQRGSTGATPRRQLMDTSTIVFGHASGTYEGLPSMEVPGVNAFIGDTFANPEGSELCSGFFELKAGEPLEYTYTYDEMKVVVEGEFHLTDLDSGQQVVARPKDVLFFPKGSRIRFETPERALGFYTGQRSFAP
jgi:ethanolamine utilization protein EutQ